ncbi:putative sucrose-phosphate synthase 4 [Dichanthelium oligosanthes]|uniref:sucrose-phosphate synthase n=1 Tax=Dichanthelium oligosanthes TaxID=888268 RepID=A0A1E5VGL4_9POAL|nr:putative sucrose-phosphate synthase 4 [Dichanthelium oligosanthes]
MAGNDWINSYLEAILDAGGAAGEISAAAGGVGGEGPARKKQDKSSLMLRERGRFSPARYFVEEVISGFDETDLYKTWVRTSAMRSPQERNTRLENMSWRIWNLARKKKQIEGEEASRLSKQRLEREKARQYAGADLSEDLSEGENNNEPSIHDESTRARMPRIGSTDAIEAWASQHKDKKLYIVLISIHGLIRGENMELGRDSDTGGQVKYVVELARALGSTPGVYRVDLLTRQISAPDVDWSYGEPTEMLSLISSENLGHEMGESSGAYIVRIPFGPRDKYIAKEHLWPHIQEFVDGALVHIMQMSKVLGEQVGSGQPLWPVVIHGHYADAGDSAALLSGALNVPMVFTGHSLGRDKLEQILKQGHQTRDEINETYKIMRRIEAEELCLDASEIIITSTRQEIEQQWGLYDGFDLTMARKLRARIKRGVSCFGRYMPRMIVCASASTFKALHSFYVNFIDIFCYIINQAIPPGMEFSHIAPHDVDLDGEEGNEDGSGSPDPPIWADIMRFFSNPHKPMILALARPDPKKNITTLVKAFGEHCELRNLANLTLIMGNRDVIDEMSSTNAAVLTSVLKLIDKYDLYGQVAYPKHHKQSEVPDIYRLAARTKGVFINCAFIEPFGLTLIEAAAYGLPMVATRNGGPVDIHRVLDNGILVDPHNQNEIAEALYKLVSDKHLWAQCRQNGLKNIHQFSWPEHCKNYLSRVGTLKPRHPCWQRSDDAIEISEADSPEDSLRDVHDISLNLKLSLDSEKSVSKEGSSNTVRRHLEDAVQKLSGGVSAMSGENGKWPPLRRRKRIIVVAVDSVQDADFVQVIKNIFEASSNERLSGSVGFVLSTSRAISEINALLISGGIEASDFDAFVCNSGSDLCYPSSSCEDMLSPAELPFMIDLDYHSQIEYRWGGEGLRKTLIRWAAEKNDESGQNVVVEDEECSSTYCISFRVTNTEAAPPVKEIRRTMRIQALRCHVLYSHDGSKLNVIPVLASRSQALRYLYIRWGVELSNMTVIVGESGDTDYEGLLGGVHKTIILKGSFNAAPNKVHTARSYSLQDVVSFEKAGIASVEGYGPDNLKSALQQFGILKD